MTVPRFFLYGKADEDIIDTMWFVSDVLSALIQHSAVTGGKVQVLAQTAFENQTPYPNFCLPTKYQRFDLAKLGNLQRLGDESFGYANSSDMATETELASYLSWACGGTAMQGCDTLNLWGHGSASSILNLLPLDLSCWHRLLDFEVQTKTFIGVVKTNPPEDKLLQPKELRAALANGGHKPGLIALNSCRVSSLEFAYDLVSIGSYLVASTNKVVWNEWPYSSWFDESNNATNFCGKEFGKHLINVKHPEFKDAQRALIDLSKVGDCKKKIDAFIDAIIPVNEPKEWRAIFDARCAVVEKNASSAGATIAVDLGAFFLFACQKLSANSATSHFACDAVKSLSAAVSARTPDMPNQSEVGISLIFPKTKAAFEQITAVKNGRYCRDEIWNAGSTYIQQSKWLIFLHKFWESTAKWQCA